MNKIKEAIKRLKKDLVIAIPTETTYGLAASIDSVEGIKKVFELKKRPFTHPLIVHVSSLEQIKKIAFVSKEEEKFIKKFYPGPLTLILRKKNHLSPLITSHEKTVAIRMPAHPLTLKLIQETGPLVAPSANPYQKLSPTKAQDVLEYFPDVFVLNGGNCSLGVESTILKISPRYYSVLRPGPFVFKDLKNFLKDKKEIKKKYKTPGQDKKHYQPKVPVFITKNKKEATLKLRKDPKKILPKLYSLLKKESLKNKPIIIFDHGIREGLWNTIWDRLYKAAGQSFQ